MRPAPLRHVIRRWPLTTFFALAFLFTWVLLPFAQKSIGASLLALFGPAAAAVITAAFSGQLRELTSRIVLWRIPIRWYVIALVLPVVISVIGTGVEYLSGAHGALRFQAISTLSMVVFFFVVGEEIGWRGFALPLLLNRFSPWVASAILGALWALWHLPLFYLDGMPQAGHPFVAYVGYTIALSILLTFLAQHTRGSVVIATLFHGSVNTFALVNTAAGPEVRGWGNAVAYGVVAVLAGVAAWETRAISRTTYR